MFIKQLCDFCTCERSPYRRRVMFCTIKLQYVEFPKKITRGNSGSMEISVRKKDGYCTDLPKLYPSGLKQPYEFVT